MYADVCCSMFVRNQDSKDVQCDIKNVLTDSTISTLQTIQQKTYSSSSIQIPLQAKNNLKTEINKFTRSIHDEEREDFYFFVVCNHNFTFTFLIFLCSKI